MGSKRGGLLFGVIVGTLLGVLFAPRKGKEIRKQLKDEVSKGGLGMHTLKKNFKEMGQDVANTAEEAYYSPEVQTAVQKGKKQVDHFMHEAGQQVGKYIDDDQIKVVSNKLHDAGKKVKALRNKVMHEMGFTKNPLHKKAKKSSKPRTRKIKIRKQK